MLDPADFARAAQWMGIATLTLAALTVLGFVLKWGVRFRLVGATGLAIVLTVGLFGLSLEPFTRTVIPGAVPYATVYDSGASEIVITVPADVTPVALDATLRQAASNLFKPYRLGVPGQTATIRARTIIHAPGGVSRLVYLGQVQPNPSPLEESEAAYVVQLSSEIGILPS